MKFFTNYAMRQSKYCRIYDPGNKGTLNTDIQAGDDKFLHMWMDYVVYELVEFAMIRVSSIHFRSS